jgi:hypothetical protein
MKDRAWEADSPLSVGFAPAHLVTPCERDHSNPGARSVTVSSSAHGVFQTEERSPQNRKN